MYITKSRLAIKLSKLRVFDQPDVGLEQYPTDSEIAAEVLWYAYMHDDLKGTVADLGAGTGILGIGALLLGASKVTFIEIDAKSARILKQNAAEFANSRLIVGDIRDFRERVDTVLQNPPFGTRQEHADREFLAHAMTISSTIYSFHKTSTIEYIKKFANKSGYDTAVQLDFHFPLKKSQVQHKSRIKRIEVSCLKLIRVA